MPEHSHLFEWGVGQQLMLFQQFSLHGSDIFYSVIGAWGYCIIELIK